MNVPLPQPLIRFRLAGRAFGLPLPLVSELADMGPLHAVPGAPPSLVGLADIRGRVVTLIDLARLLGLGETKIAGEEPSGDRTFALILAQPFSHLALLAGRDTDLAHLEPTYLLTPLPGADGYHPWREVPLSDGSSCVLIEAPAVIAQCSRQLRDRYRLR